MEAAFGYAILGISGCALWVSGAWLREIRVQRAWLRCVQRDLAVRHATERAELDRWEIEARHFLEHGEDAL